MNICVYCSSSNALDNIYYEEGYRFGQMMADKGHSLVYGGYCRGIMAEVARGVYDGGGKIISVVPDVFDREGFTFDKSTVICKVGSMSERKARMEELADAFAVLPGGIGTLDELFEIYVLRSLGLADMKIGILNSTGFFNSLESMLDDYVRKGFLSEGARDSVAFYRDSLSLLEALESAHPFDPLFDDDSEILILGSYPSVKSRETNFYYGHRQNRFWKVLADIYGEDVPVSVDEKKAFLHRRHIALWDVIQSCDITGSSDSSIRNVVPCDLSKVLSRAPKIKKIFVNGSTAGRYYRKYMKEISIPMEVLPSTSPANAAWSLERLSDEWKKIKDDTENRD